MKQTRLCLYVRMQVCVWWGVGEGEREIETDRQTDRQTDREMDGQGRWVVGRYIGR